MKKIARRRTTGKARQAAGPDAAADRGLSRRALLLRAGFAGAGVLALGGAGIWGMTFVRSVRAEHDLTRLGQGRPAVVQVHDPQCPVCNALQDQTRAALRDIDERAVLYLIANIRTPEGVAFAAQYGVPHVTLLLFDGTGRLRETLSGPRRAEALRPAFARLAQRG